MVPRHNGQEMLLITLRQQIQVKRMLELEELISQESAIRFIGAVLSDQTWLLIRMMHDAMPSKRRGHQNALLMLQEAILRLKPATA